MSKINYTQSNILNNKIMKLIKEERHRPYWLPRPVMGTALLYFFIFLLGLYSY
jgi:hypothetical protein